VSGASVQFAGTTVPAGTVQIPQGTAIAVNMHSEAVTIDNNPIPADVKSLPGFAPEVVYDIVYVQGDMMFFGDDTIEGFDAETPETRPATIDANFVYNRVR